MGKAIVSKPRFNASSTGVQNDLVNSLYQTLLVAYAAIGSITVPASNLPGHPYAASVTIGQTLGFVPLVFYYDNSAASLGGSYYSFAFVQEPGGTQNYLFPGDPWIFYYPATGTPYTANYFYYVLYLPSQGSPSDASNFKQESYFADVAKEGDNVLTTPLQNLSWGSQVPSLLAAVANPTAGISYQSYNAAATIGAPGTQTFSFAHHLNNPYPFIGVIKNWNAAGQTQMLNFNTYINLTGGALYVDNTNFYYNYSNPSHGPITINQTLEVYYLTTIANFP